MSKIGCLCGIWMFLTFNGLCLGQNSFVFEIDGESIKYEAPSGYCAMPDTTLVHIWFEKTGHIGIAAFYPCIQNEDIYKGALDRISSWIFITTPQESDLRNFNMSREQFLRESQTLLRTVIIGQKRATYYGNRQVPENFKRPTPLLLSNNSDEYAVYQLGPYFVEKDGEIIKKAQEQVAATTLIKGKVINIIYSETDFAQTKCEMMLKRLKKNAKAFVEGNCFQTQSRP